MLASRENPLKVVFVTSGYPHIERPLSGIFVHRSIKILSAKVNSRVLHLRGWKVKRPFIEKRVWDGIPVVRIAVPHYPSYNLVRLNAKILSNIGFYLAKTYIQDADLIHSTGIYPTGFIANQWAKRLHKVHTSQAIGRDVNLYLAANAHGSNNWLYTINGISCNSKALYDQILSIAPNLSNVGVIYRGVDTHFFSPEGNLKGPQINLPPVKFLYLGGFQTWKPKKYDQFNYKGGHILLEAWRLAEAHLGNSNLLIGGSGVDFSRLETWRASLKRPHLVRINPAINPEDVPGYLRAADVVILPSVTDGLPNLANEAQACGRPVLGTDAGGISESVVNGQSGIIISRDDSQALAHGLIWFHEHQSRLLPMGVAARQRMIKSFTWEDFSDGMMKMFNCAMKGSDIQIHPNSG